MSGPNSEYDPVQVTPLDEEHVNAMREAALAAIAAAADLEALKRARTEHAGDRSPLALANREIGALPPQARKDAGQRVGQARGEVNQALAKRQAELEAEAEQRMLVEETVDVTLPSDRRTKGARHPLTMMSERIADVFVAMGWEVAEGPLVEAEWLNFDALNLGPDHPARTMQDTFWTEPAEHHLVLRTHTSPVQARTMLTRKPPIYVVVPGRVFRTDEYDATHSPLFHQVEGLVVDEGITMAHLKGTLDHFAESMFGEGISTRFRPSYFPFTEPSAEVDLKCFVCRGQLPAVESCRTCKGEGWIEWGGCGVVNPRVLTACGVDNDRYTGFAFGMGIDRTLMFRHGVADMRDMFEGDVRFSAAFGAESVKAPLSWVREYADLPADAPAEDIAARLTALGLKLESLERPGHDITGPLVIGRVLTKEPEPQKNGKTINWCTVDVGDANGTGEPQGIVCGAHNFEPGDLVVVVLPGGVLPGGFEISARKTYGHVSAGMICSAKELGLGDDHDGIIVLPSDAGEPGDDVFDLLHLRDEVVELEINPDRAYAMSVRGVAREASLGYAVPFHDPADRETPAGQRQGLPGRGRRPRGLPGLRGAHRLGFRPHRARHPPGWRAG